MSSIKPTNNTTDLPDFIFELFNDIGQREGFVDFNVILSAGSNHGDGFMGIMSRVVIKGQRNGQDDKLSLMLKMPPSNIVRQEQFNSRAVFEKEIYMYTVLLPAFVKFQLENGLTKENGFFAFPKCYATVNDMDNQRCAIILEDLKTMGYDMWNKFECIDINTLEIVLKEMGKLHGLSFAMKDKDPATFVPFAEMEDALLAHWIKNQETILAPMINSFCDIAISTIDPSETELLRKMDLVKLTYMDILTDCFTKNTPSTFDVITHGDCWMNNMMFLYNASKTPRSVCLIDWQLSRFCSPAADIIYFIFSSTSKTVRDAHYENLLRIYHNSLTDILNIFRSDANQLFPYEELKNQLMRVGKLGLVTSPMLLQIITADPENIPDMDKTAENIASREGTFTVSFSDRSKEIYSKRVNEVIKDIIELGYF